jgi:hypothetical protein
MYCQCRVVSSVTGMSSAGKLACLQAAAVAELHDYLRLLHAAAHGAVLVLGLRHADDVVVEGAHDGGVVQRAGDGALQQRGLAAVVVAVVAAAAAAQGVVRAADQVVAVLQDLERESQRWLASWAG